MVLVAAGPDSLPALRYGVATGVAAVAGMNPYRAYERAVVSLFALLLILPVCAIIWMFLGTLLTGRFV